MATQEAVAEAARAVRATARAVRCEAVTARWRAQSSRLVTRDVTVQLAWTTMQVSRRQQGERGYFSPLPQEVVRSLDS